MKSIKTILVAITVLLSFTASKAQIKNTNTETVKIYGNCGMCESTIEKAGNIKNIAKVDWSEDSKMATLTYDTIKTNKNEILKRIALSGYDSDSFLAPQTAYSNLPGCCQYDRVAKIAMVEPVKTEVTDAPKNASKANEDVNPLKLVFENYFAIKDALVKTNQNMVSTSATALLSAINEVKMEKLKTNEHNVWMKVLKNIKEDTEQMATAKNVKEQRDYFDTLSKNMYDLIKVSKQETPTYYQFCPMANNGKGANWLSKVSVIKNPYYGSVMLSCGSTVETIK